MSLTLSDEYEAQFNAWRDEAEAADLVGLIRDRGHKLAKSGREWVGPCPNCGGHDRFSINTQERVFNCRGFGGGGYIDGAMHAFDCTFLEACEALAGRPSPERPGRKKKAAAKPKQDDGPPPVAPLPEDGGMAERDEPSPPEGSDHSVDERQAGRTVADLFDSGKPIRGTLAEAYLAGRRLAAATDWTFDLRFADALAYLGLETPACKEPKFLGKYPAMLAAIRNAQGDIIGVHRTYLDPDGRGRLKPPGDPKRNAAKKVVGKVMGGLIWLSPPRPLLVVGEGIETSRSGFLLGIGGADAAVAATVTLGNMAGAPTENMPHPKLPRRSVPNGVPDMERPGFIPPQVVEELIFLGDGDSDRPFTLAQLLLAGRRQRAEGRQAFFAMARDGKDWNDVLQERGEEE